MKLTRRNAVAAGIAALAAGGLWHTRTTRFRDSALARYDAVLVPPEGPLNCYHLGHSLVGRDMPAMVAQLAGQGHSYHSQLGWGTPLKAHWEADVPINGFDVENAHPLFRPAKAAIASGDYDAVILTEMVELRDAIRYHDGATYLAKWAALARSNNPKTRVYMYETWHHLDDAGGWSTRLDNDLNALWERKVVLPAVAQIQAPIYIIPAGQVLAGVVRAVEAAGGIGNVTDRTSLFGRSADGKIDTIHLSDLGLYLVALVHFATLYHRSPVGLPYRLKLADGSAAQTPDEKSAKVMQEITWAVVRNYNKSGVSS